MDERLQSAEELADDIGGRVVADCTSVFRARGVGNAVGRCWTFTLDQIGTWVRLGGTEFVENEFDTRRGQT